MDAVRYVEETRYRCCPCTVWQPEACEGRASGNDRGGRGTSGSCVKMAPTCIIKKVPYTVLRPEPYQKVVEVPRRVVTQEPYTVTVCVPRVVYREVPTTICCPDCRRGKRVGGNENRRQEACGQ